jgi:hypothetical protein
MLKNCLAALSFLSMVFVAQNALACETGLEKGFYCIGRSDHYIHYTGPFRNTPKQAQWSFMRACQHSPYPYGCRITKCVPSTMCYDPVYSAPGYSAEDNLERELRRQKWRSRGGRGR